MAKRSKTASGKRPRKTVVLALVEGESDKIALYPVLRRLYGDEATHLCFATLYGEGGDLTASAWVTPGNIERRIYTQCIWYNLEQDHIYPKDLTEVLMFVDLDGAFCPDGAIHAYVPDPAVYHGTRNCCEYHPTHINAVFPGEIADRNRRKSANLRHLAGLSRIRVDSRTVPFSMYYFSCNREHFLGQDPNSPGRDKTDLAHGFADRVAAEGDAFLRSLCGDAFCSGGYEASWQRVQEGLSSLEPHSNIGLLIRRLLDSPAGTGGGEGEEEEGTL